MTRRAAVAVATLSILVLARCGTAAAAGGDGLYAEYFTNVTLTGPPAATQVDPEIGFNWGSGGPACISPNVDNFSVRWTGYVQPAYSETYTFYAFTDDGARLWVDGVQLVDRWIDQGPIERSGAISLTADVLYDIVFEYYDRDGEAAAELRWGSMSQVKEIIPQTRLSFFAGPSLVAWWKLDETDGLVAEDCSGGGNDGELSGMDPATDWVPGRIGGALDFDGVDDYVGTISPIEISGSQSRTVAFWALARDTSNGGLVGWGAAGLDQEFRACVIGHKWAFYGHNSDADWFTGVPVVTGVWQHHALTYDGLTLRWFIDGAEIGSHVYVYGTADTAVWLGKSEGFLSGYFTGRLDDVRIYSRALTTAEILALHEAGLKGAGPDLPPAVTPFAGGCSGEGRDSRTEAVAWALVLAATLSIVPFVHRPFGKREERRKERNMVRRATLLVMAVTLPLPVFSAPAQAEGAAAEGTAAATPAAGETKPATAPEGEVRAEPAPQPPPAAPAPEGTRPGPETPAAVEVPAGPALVPEPEAPEEPRARHFGVRAGVFVPSAADDETYSESFTAGAFYAGDLPGAGGLLRLPFEIGLDYARGSSDDGRVDADLYALRFDLLFSKWGSIPPRPDFYLLGGYHVVFASPDVDGEGGEGEYVSAFNLGLGLGSPESAFDARVAYSVLAGSGNLRGLLTATAGLRF